MSPHKKPSLTIEPPLVCVSPSHSSPDMDLACTHDGKTIDGETTEPMERMRCSFPSLSHRCPVFRDVSFNSYAFLVRSPKDGELLG